MRSSLFALAAMALLGCAAEPNPPPATPVAETIASPAVQAADPFVIAPPARDEVLPQLKQLALTPAKSVLTAPPHGLAGAPPTCGAFAARKATGTCPAAADVLGTLDRALTEGDVARRDQMLADLEPCAGLPTGIARALRGELAPTVCGEALQDAWLKQPPANVTPAVYHAVLGQAVASRLARAGANPPTLAPPYDKPRVLAFTKGPLMTWFAEQAAVVQTVAQAAVDLPYYAQAITAIEAGMADMRLVEAVRAAPIPTEFAKDAELKNAYYASLDQMLDPRKDRGRDAALVGLRQFAFVGSLRDARIDSARAMLARLYGGRRIDALDALLLPPIASPAPSSVEERIAAHAPTFYAGLLLDENAATRTGTMQQFASRGVPLPMRAALQKATLSPEVRGLYARARLESARLYWRGVDFDQAAALAAAWPSGSARPPEVTLVFAVALALRAGPEDAIDMMKRAPLTSTAEPNVDALDAVAHARGSQLAAFAAFDGALARQVLAPQGSKPAYFDDIARRYRDAASKLADPKQKTEADARGAAAAAMATAAH